MQTWSPKVKAFVLPPFNKCPNCGTMTYGRLTVSARRVALRCTTCWFDGHLNLPPITKRLIYIDQYVISEIMKALDPDQPHPEKYVLYRRLYEKLDRLHKLQLIVCPESDIHEAESVVHKDFEKLRRIYQQLSGGIVFYPPVLIQIGQLQEAFTRFRKKTVTHPITRRTYLSENPDEWKGTLMISPNWMIPGYPQTVLEQNKLKDAGMIEVCERWRDQDGLTFEGIYQEEMSSIPKVAFNQFNEFNRHVLENLGNYDLDKLTLHAQLIYDFMGELDLTPERRTD